MKENERMGSELHETRSVAVSKAVVILFALGYLAVVIGLAWLYPWLKEVIAYRADRMWDDRLVYTSVYACAVPIGLILFHLWGLLANIGREEIFTSENIAHLRWISYLCFAVALIAFASALYATVWLLAMACMLLMGVLIRVIKNVFVRALAIKEENDFTI